MSSSLAPRLVELLERLLSKDGRRTAAEVAIAGYCRRRGVGEGGVAREKQTIGLADRAVMSKVV